MSAGSPGAAAAKAAGGTTGGSRTAGAGGGGGAEPCSHPVQVSGLCAICGVELETLPPDERSASAADEPVSILHSHASLKVTRSEAARIHAQTTSDLLNTRRLALIVDLDQTVIHATVDPTVGEWMKDRTNPNHGALRDVKRFRLGMDGKPVPKVSKAVRRARTNAKAGAGVKAVDGSNGKGAHENGESDEGSDDDEEGSEAGEGKEEDDDSDEGKEEEDDDDDPALGCWYYIKPRPGLVAFLRTLSTLYELHVYTMGTRSYASSVCAIIDPDGTLFADRILSRDENDDGAAASAATSAVAAAAAFRKSLARLFPVDTSMVVIIDDRADVWKWSPNLVKVVPFDFFVGIGDINASFLPAPTTAQLPTPPTTPPSKDAQASDSPSPSSSAATDPISPSAADAPDPTATLVESGADAAQRVALEIQAAERPLAKMQEALEEEKDAQAGPTSSDGNGVEVRAGNEKGKEKEKEVQFAAAPLQLQGHQQRAAVLKEDDRELDRLQRVLNDIHSRWYVAWDNVRQESGGRAGDLMDALARMPDAANIIAEMKAQVLKGCHIVFSGVVPLGQNLELSDPWRTATEFGARCHRDLTSSVTHLVAARGGTAKVYQAQRQKHPRIWIVRPRWLAESCERWTRSSEDLFELEPMEGGAGGAESSGSSGRRVVDGLSAPPPPPVLDEGEGEVTAMVDDTDDDDDDDQGSGGTGAEGGGAGINAFGGFDAVDWGEAADEVDAFLDGLDDEGDTTDGGYGSDQSMGRKTPQPERGSKRGRTSTDESDLGEGTSPPVTTVDQQKAEGQGRSPLSKRRKIASARVGQSKLKHSFDPSAIDSDDDDDRDNDNGGGGNGVSSRRGTITSGKRMDSDADDDDDDGDDEDDGGNAKKKRRRQQQQQQDDDEDEDGEDEDEGGGGQRRHSLFLKRAAGRNSGGTTKHASSLDNNGTGASQEEGDDVEDVDDQEGSVGSLIDESFLDGLADEIALDLEEGD